MSRKFGMERKGLLLEGSNHKIEDKQVPGIYIYIYVYAIYWGLLEKPALVQNG